MRRVPYIKISIIGTRGIPARYGGFETFAEEISPRLIKEGYSISVQCDKSKSGIEKWSGVDLHYSPFTKSDNPIKYYFEGINWGLKNSDIILVAGTGGSIFYLLNLFYRKVIFTNTDGLESRRSKWGYAKRLYIKISEILAIWWSDVLIADSKAVSQYLQREYHCAKKKTVIAEYGACLNENCDRTVLEKYNLNAGDYYLIVSRIEPENNIQMIIEGFNKAETRCSLAIVGQITNTAYCNRLFEKFRSDKILFLGSIYDKQELNSLRYACKAYIHGHSVGGTNPSLLEAMANGNIIICHNNLFNREVTADSQFYFNNSEEVASVIANIEKLSDNLKLELKELSRQRINTYYNWDNIIKKYLAIFNNITIKEASNE